MSKDYKKLYEESIERARDLHDNHAFGKPFIYETCEYIFPELRESEDEKIKKALIKNFTNQHSSNFPTTDGFTREQTLAWLEKQGEQNKQHLYDIIIALWNLLDKIDTFSDLQIDDTNPDNPFRKIEDITQERHKFVKSDGYNLFIENFMITNNKNFEKQDEQKSTDKVEPRFEVGDCIRYRGDNYKIKDIETTKHGFIYNVAVIGKPSDPEEVKTAIGIAAEKDMVKIEQPSWSEEDERMKSLIISTLTSMGTLNLERYHHMNLDEVKNWFKSLKDRVQPQPKQEWSEEDKSMYIRTLGILGKCYMGELPTKVEEELRWFKSLKPQNRWKPSEEQMEALLYALGKGGTYNHEALTQLYNNLKTL